MGTFQYKLFQKNLQAGKLDSKQVKAFIDEANGVWYKRLSTELVMNYVSYVEITKDKDALKVIADHDGLTEIHNQILTLLDDYDGFMNNDYIEQLLDARAVLMDFVKALTSYSEYAKMLEYVANRKEISDKELIDDESFCGDIIRMIFSEEDNILINDKIHSIYEQMPIRISKQKFYNLVELSMDPIKGISEKSLDDYIKYLQESFAPEKVDGVTTMVPSIYQELISMDMDTTEAEEVLYQQDTLDEVALELIDMISILTMISEVVNLMIGLQLISVNMEQTDIEKHHIKVKWVFDYICKNKAEDNIIDDLLFQNLTKLEGVIENASEKLMHYNGMHDQLVSSGFEVTEELTELFRPLDQCERLTSGSFFGDLDSSVDGQIASNTYIAEKRNVLIGYMKDQFSMDNRLMQRSRMAHMLSIMNIVQSSPQDIYEFILANFKGCKNIREKLQCQELVLAALNEYDSFLDEYADEYGDEFTDGE